MYESKEKPEFKGFVVDLIAKIAEKADFDYRLHEVADGTYGIMRDGKWNGLIRELVDKVRLLFVMKTMTDCPICLFHRKRTLPLQT